MAPAIVKLFATVLALVGPAPADSPKEFQLKSGQQIVAIGDSITAEGGVRETGFLRRIDAVLAKQYPDKTFPKVINAGRGGQRSEHLVPRFDTDVLKLKPAYVVIAVGINDVWQRLQDPQTKKLIPHDEKMLAEYKKNVTAMVDAAQKAGIKVILLTPTVIGEDVTKEGNKRLPMYVEAEKQIAAEKKCQLVDMHAMFLTALKQKPAEFKDKNWLTVDGAHMNPLGDAIMAVGVLRALGVPDEKIAASDPATTTDKK